MDHRIEPGKDVAPIPLADPSEPLAAEGFRPGLRDEHVIQSTGESEPFALVEEGQQVTPASEQEVVQYIRSCEASSPENLAQLARDGLALLHRVDYTVSQELQGPYGRARRSYEALKHTIKQLKESVEKPAPVLDVAIKLLREYKERSVFKDRLATDSAFFDAVRLGVILGSGAGRRDEDISVGGGLNDDKRKAALERPTKEKPKRLTMEEKAALREEKRARLRAGAQPQPDQAEAAEPEEEATDDGTAEQELLQAETTQARAHLERAKELQQYFKAPLAVLTQPYQELKQKNPDLFQQKMYDLAASLADWLRAEADMGESLLLTQRQFAREQYLKRTLFQNLKRYKVLSENR